LILRWLVEYGHYLVLLYPYHQELKAEKKSGLLTIKTKIFSIGFRK